MTELKLGKIKSVKLGLKDGRLGIEFTLTGPGWGTFDHWWTWSPESVKVTEHTKWTEEDRDKEMVSIIRRLDKLLHEAKKTDFADLKDVPIEVEFQENCLKSFRILTEVL